MTVQISITVWTILCLVALMLILDRLLFRPLLSFMDKRREKIDQAKAEKETALHERDEALRKLEEAKDGAMRAAAVEAAANEEKLRGEMSNTVAEAKEQFFRKLQEEKDLLEKESVSIQNDLEPRMEDLADLFAHKLLSWQEQMTIASDADSSAPVMDAAAMAALSSSHDIQEAVDGQH